MPNLDALRERIKQRNIKKSEGIEDSILEREEYRTKYDPEMVAAIDEVRMSPERKRELTEKLTRQTMKQDRSQLGVPPDPEYGKD